jgi:hypothetical protein
VAALLFGVVLGLVVGTAVTVARRAWTEYVTTKAGLPGMRRGAWVLIRIAASRVGIVALICVVAVAWAAIDGQR